ncbi:MAG: MFS transporter [Verrucomicrobiales bacterium]|nr:MFS transporter [Verrucomicrobiales bacterium]
MVATLPGRTVGLGLITEQLLVDLGVTRSSYAELNLWATFLGALFLFGTGPALDRSLRWTTTVVLATFSGAVFWLAHLPGPGLLLPVLILTRGLGQSSLSLSAVAIVGKSFKKKLSTAMGIFAVATSLLFVAAIPSVDSLLGQLGWRNVWIILAAVILGISLLVAFLIRDPQAQNGHGEDDETATGMPFREALRSPAFWVLTIGIGIYYFAFTGITLFSESLVVSLDFSKDIRNWFLAIMMFSGLASNLYCGWLAQRISVLNIFGGAMIIFAACLIGFPLASGSIGLISTVAVALGIGSGAVTVIFFAGFADLFGKRHLGKIQGVAQTMTVASSGTGPLIFARSFESSGSYSSVFFTLAPLALLVGIWALCHQRRNTFPEKRSKPAH